MSSRYDDLSLLWASDGSAIDPDLDTTNPIFQQNKFVKGWIVEKEPSAWQNYLYQITDQKNQLTAAEQLIEWESDISYATGAIVRQGELYYVQVNANAALNQNPSAGTTYWLPILGVSASVVTTAVNTLTTLLNNHLAATNPHKDTIEGIGGYSSTAIDNMLGDVTDPRTITYHEAQTGAVHKETPAQVGTLPVAGGTFTGDVAFDGGVILGSARLGQDGPDISFGNKLGSITLQSDGVGVYVAVSTGVRSDITTVLNFLTQQNAVNPLFTLPQALVALDLRLDLNNLGIGNQIATTTIDPVFEAQGMTFDTFKTISLNNANFGGLPTTCYIVGYDGSNVVGLTFNSSVSSWNALGDYFSSRLVGATHIKYLFIYPQLTDAQISTLKR